MQASMDSLDSIDTETILSGQSEWIEPDLMKTLSEYCLDCTETEFPHFVFSIDSMDDIDRPMEQHPIFYGCFDWHSAVHSHWCLIRQLRLVDDHPEESEIRQSLASRITVENVEQEVGYFETNETFEKPYGWAWFLRLSSELALWDDHHADDWRDVLGPLEDRIVELVRSEFLPQDRPFRVGTHANSAFALQGVLDYARVTDNASLESETLETSKEFYMKDRNAPVEYEPLGWDFLSPTLVEADLMRRVLDQDEFVKWFDGFLPDVTVSPRDTFLEPIEVNPESDSGIELHLVGLNLSKAWCLADLVSVLDGHLYVEQFEEGARRHTEYGLRGAFTEDYAGAHWLSSYVLYLLTRNDGGIAPA